MLTNTNYATYRKIGPVVGGLFILLFTAYMLGWMTTDDKLGLMAIPLVVGLCGVFILLKYPNVGFALMFFLIPLGPITRIGGPRSIEFFLGVLLMGVFVSRILLLHEKIKFDRISLLGCIFAAWAVLSSVWAEDTKQALFHAIVRLSQMIAFYVLIINYCRNERRLDIITLSFIAGAVLAALITLVKGVKVSDTERTSFAKGFDPNYFSLIISLSMILMFYYFYKTKYKLLQIIFILCSLVITYVIIKAQSRGVWVALPISFLLTVAILHRNSKIVKYVTRVSVVLVLGVVSAYYSGVINESVVERVKTLTYLFSDDPQVRVTGRFEILDVGKEMIKNTMPFGVGYANFKLVWNQYRPLTDIEDLSWQSRRAKGAHNTFLAVLAELGIFGFIIFIAIFIHIFRNIMRIGNPTTRFIFIWLIAFFMIDSLTLVTHTMPWFWFMLALIVLRAKFERQTKQLADRMNYSSIPR